ncbi:hypothetical protein ABZX40_15140 [Streptomyces sp. NPDC004610]|uniref:hypothetical protein n=1 Tax=unclassified Streptomyces TaxID=2593676 RepID=UPI0033A14742
MNDDGEEPAEDPRVEVGGEWHGQVLLCLGGFPDGRTRFRDRKEYPLSVIRRVTG